MIDADQNILFNQRVRGSPPPAFTFLIKKSILHFYFLPSSHASKKLLTVILKQNFKKDMSRISDAMSFIKFFFNQCKK